jgi:chemotaxis protein MotB
MSQSPQPFTDLVTKQQTRPAATSGWGWPVAIVAGALLAVVSYLWYAGIDRQKEEVKSLRAKLEETSARLAAATTENEANQKLLGELKSNVAELEAQKASTVQNANSLENEMRSELASRDVTISRLQGKLTVNILDRIMFDSGEAVLKSGGADVMRKIANLLAEHPDIKIHVIGHTDNVPIRPTAHSRFASNWELSAARALAAVHYLTEQAGVDPRRVGAVGYGEFRPIADNATAEGRARNRRIAITILPDELAGADTAPTAQPVQAATNPPPAAVVVPAPVIPKAVPLPAGGTSTD